MLYNCNICGKQFKQKCHYTNHLNRINPCIKLTKKIPQNPQISSEIPPTSTKNYSCSFCKDQFTRSDHLKRHLDRCKIRKEECKEKDEIFKKLLEQNNILMSTIDIQKDQINQLIKANDNLVQQIKLTKSQTQNNKNIKNQNNGTINNINIIQFGKEDLSAIDNKPFFEALNAMGYNIPVKMVEGIHANDLHPEFKNIYISDINREKAMVHNGSSWILDKFDNVSDQILDKSINFLEDRFKQLKKENKLPKNKKDIIERRLKILDKIKEFDTDDEDDTCKKINKKEKDRRQMLRTSSKEGIKLTLYNKRNKIINEKDIPPPEINCLS
jgi:hypothetical protein